MSMSHNEWYQQRYGDAQAHRQHRQNLERVTADYAEVKARQQTQRIVWQGDAAAIFAEHQIQYEVRGHSWLCQVGREQIYYWPKSGRWRVKGQKKSWGSRGAQDFLRKVQTWQEQQHS